MFLEKLKSLSLVLIVALLGVGVVVGFSRVRGGDEPPAESPAEKDKPSGAADKPIPTGLGQLYLHRGLDLTIYDLRRKKFIDLPPLDEEHKLGKIDGNLFSLQTYQAESARLSPDGRFLAFGQARGTPPHEIQIREVARGKEPRSVVRMPKKELSNWCWSPDGKQILFSAWPGEKDDHYHPYVVEVATGKVQPVTLPELKGEGKDRWGAWVHGWSPDGLWLVFSKGRVYLVDPQTKDVPPGDHGANRLSRRHLPILPRWQEGSVHRRPERERI